MGWLVQRMLCDIVTQEQEVFGHTFLVTCACYRWFSTLCPFVLAVAPSRIKSWCLYKKDFHFLLQAILSEVLGS